MRGRSRVPVSGCLTSKALVWLFYAVAVYTVAALTLFGCAEAPYVWVSDVQAPPEGNRSFVIVPGDVLAISVYNEDQLSGSTKVRSDGYITLSLVGEVLAAGKTPSALAQELQTGYSKFLQAPNVAIRVEAEEEIRVTLIGEVESVGNVTLPRNSGLMRALAAGGGLSDFADKDAIFVIRQNPSVRIRFSYQDLVDNDPQAVGFTLLNGDVVYVE